MKQLTATNSAQYPGVWRIRMGKRSLSMLVQPILMSDLGIVPSAQDIREAVKDTRPDLAIAADIPVVFESR